MATKGEGAVGSDPNTDPSIHVWDASTQQNIFGLNVAAGLLVDWTAKVSPHGSVARQQKGTVDPITIVDGGVTIGKASNKPVADSIVVDSPKPAVDVVKIRIADLGGGNFAVLSPA